MSWSIVCHGSLAEVSRVLENEKENAEKYPCSDPEQGVRLKALELIGSAMEAQRLEADAPVAFRLEAWGSQSSRYAQGSGDPVRVTNTLHVAIEVIEKPAAPRKEPELAGKSL